MFKKTVPYLLKEIKDLIVAETYGAGSILNPDVLGLKSAKNYISKYDPIPLFANPFEYLHAKFFKPAHVLFLESDSVLTAHNWNSSYVRQCAINTKIYKE